MIRFIKSKDNRSIPPLIIGFVLPIKLYLTQLGNITNRDPNSSTIQIHHFSSVGIEALASVLAIVVSVTLVAVQFGSQEYSKRVMEYYIKSYGFKTLVGLYLGTILFNIFMLNYQFSDPNIETNMMTLSIVLSVACFIFLIPYFIFTMHALQPDYLLEKLLKHVDKKYLKTIRKKWKIGLYPPLKDRDSVLAVADIIKKAIGSNDRLLIRDGLDKMCGCYNLLNIKGNDNSYLFSVDASELEESMSKEVISEELERVFETKGFPLSKNATIRNEKEYLFSWDDIPGKDNEKEKLRKFLVEDIGIDWAEDAEIDKSNYDTTISIHKDEKKSAEINMGVNKKKTILKISDGRTRELKVKAENDKLKIYEKEDEWVLINEKKIYTIKKEEGKLNIYDNVIPAYFIEHFLAISSNAIINSDDDAITQILKIFEDIMTIQYLFSIDAKFENDLNNGNISKEFMDKFKLKGFSIPEFKNAMVTKEKEDNWEITDGEKIYIVKKEYGKLSIYMIHNSEGITFGDPTYPAIYALYIIAKEALNSKLTAQTKKLIVEKFTDVVKKPEQSKLMDLGIQTAKQIDLELATTNVLKKLLKFEDRTGLAGVGGKAVQDNQKDAAEHAIRMLNELGDEEGAMRLLIRATENELEVQSVGGILGESMAEIFRGQIEEAMDLLIEATDNGLEVQSVGERVSRAEIFRGLIDLDALENGICRCTLKKDDSNEIILEINSCCIKTITNFDDRKIQSYCRKTRLNEEQGQKELPICTLTYRYLTDAIAHIKGEKIELKSVEWDENGCHRLTFRCSPF